MHYRFNRYRYGCSVSKREPDEVRGVSASERARTCRHFKRKFRMDIEYIHIAMPGIRITVCWAGVSGFL